MIKYFKTIFCTAIMCFCVNTYAAPHIQSGKYEFIMLAVTPDNRVEGYYFEDMSDVVKKTCRFYFNGALGQSDQVPIKTWLDDTYTGTLEASQHGIKLTVPHNTDHPGCMNTMYPEIDSSTGAEYSLIDSKPWIGLIKVKDKKVYLYETSSKSAKRRAYIVTNDVVGVVRYDGDWAYVEFINNRNQSYKGWVRIDQMTAL